ncbi:MAG: hypothetical protein LC789_01190 [Actinobacteria bacterium]|nr:hypothetical protein [Actinomycetota bacterium]MCA1722342.1 hypothetical protein [Actinomycetota bacterium]
MRRRVLLLLALLGLLVATVLLVTRPRTDCVGPFDHLGDRLLGRSYSVRCAG